MAVIYSDQKIESLVRERKPLPSSRYGDFLGTLRRLIADASLEVPPDPQGHLFEEG